MGGPASLTYLALRPFTVGATTYAVGDTVDVSGISNDAVAGLLRNGWIASSTPHADLAAHNTLGLATQAELDGHNHDATYVNETANTWTALPYQNDWADYGSGYEEGEYYKDEIGFVHLRGVLSGAGAGCTQGSVIATLPTGYRPAKDEILNGFMVGNTLFRCNVRTTGNIEYGSGGDNPLYISFTHIKFFAA